MIRKTPFFQEWFWFQLNDFELVLDMALKFFTSVAKLEVKRVKTRSQTVLGTNSYVYRSYRGIGFKFFRIAILPILAILYNGEQLLQR